MSLLNFLFGDQANALLERTLKHTLEPFAGYLRRLGFGMVLILLSGAAWSSTFLLILLALFFHLGHLATYASPALWTALVSAILGLITAWVGIRLVRKPR